MNERHGPLRKSKCGQGLGSIHSEYLAPELGEEDYVSGAQKPEAAKHVWLGVRTEADYCRVQQNPISVRPNAILPTHDKTSHNLH